MTIYLSNRDGTGKTSEQGHYRLQTRVFDGNVLEEDDLRVTQLDSPNMAVKVSSGDYKIPFGEYSYTGWNSAYEEVELATADPANQRKSTIVLYVDRGEATSPSPVDNPGITKLTAVAGTASATPTAPNNATIQSAIGLGNPFIKLAEVNVPAAATSIINSYIVDTRQRISIADDVVLASNLLQNTNDKAYPVGSLYFNATNASNPATLLGVGTWTSFGAGRVVVGFDAGDTDFNSSEETGGSKNHSHTLNNAAAQIGARSGQADTIGYRNRDIGSLSGSIYNIKAGNISGTTRSHNTALTGTTDDSSHLQPYITVYIWKRTA